MIDKEQLKLIYVLSVGDNSKGEGVYEFIFSSNPQEIDEKKLCWDVFPAKYNAEAPEGECVYSFKTDLFSLKCLHEINDRCYLDGLYKIHAIAYEDYEFKNKYGIDYNDVLTFHFGITFNEVETKLYKRDIIVDDNKNEFIQARNMNLKRKKHETEGLIF